MPLTSELRDPRRPLSRFLREHFPHTQPIAAAFRVGTTHATNLGPLTSLGRHYSTIGTAFDWRLRYYLSTTPGRGLRASASMDPEWATFLASLDDVVRRIRPVGRRLTRGSEDLLNRYCIVLALREQLDRAGAPLQSSPLFDPESGQTLAELLAIARDDWLDDLRALSWGAHETLGDLLAPPAILNPSFEGSNDVGGADADLILDDCLIEIKTTLNPRWNRNWLYQLLGYVLLDYSDRYKIRSIGIYLARQRVFLRWPLDEVIAMVTGERRQPLEYYRVRLREALTQEKRWHGEPLGGSESAIRASELGRTRRVRGGKTKFESADIAVQLTLPVPIAEKETLSFDLAR